MNLKENFEKAYDEWSEKIFSFALYKLSDREKALDVTQESFMKTWDYLRGGNEINNLRAFLYKTANNLIIDEYRRRDRRKTGSLDSLREEGFQIEDSGDETIRNRSEAKGVIEYIRKLKEPYREPLMLRLVDEIPVKEIAKIMEEEPTTISVRIHRGIKQIREMMKEDE